MTKKLNTGDVRTHEMVTRSQTNLEGSHTNLDVLFKNIELETAQPKPDVIKLTRCAEIIEESFKESFKGSYFDFWKEKMLKNEPHYIGDIIKSLLAKLLLTQEKDLCNKYNNFYNFMMEEQLKNVFMMGNVLSDNGHSEIIAKIMHKYQECLWQKLDLGATYQELVKVFLAPFSNSYSSDILDNLEMNESEQEGGELSGDKIDTDSDLGQ
jgi:hypothetical protein